MKRHRRAHLAGIAGLAVALAIPSVAAAQTPLPNFRVVYSTDTDADLAITDTVNPPVKITTGPERDTSPDWSNDGSAIVFQRTTPNGRDSDLWVVAPDGSGLRQLTRGRAFDRGARWSPDGTRVVFARRVGNAGSDIWVVNADGTGLRRLTRKPAGESAPAWSPDGQRIAYVVTGGTRPDQDIWTMNANGRNQKVLVATRAVEGEPDWTPDGTRIVFSRESGRIPRRPAPLNSPIRYNLDIWSVPAAGGARTRLTTRAGDDYGPRVSPDGTRFLYQSELTSCVRRGCNVEVFIGAFDGTPAVQVTNRPGTDAGGDWGPAAPAPPAPPAPPPA